MAALPLPPALAIREEPFSEEELDEAVDALAAGLPVPAAVGKFIIDDDAKAEWAGRHFKAFETQRVAAIDQATEWHDQIGEWLQAELARLDPRIGIFEEALKRYAINRRQADEKNAKTTNLPSVIVRTHRSKTPIVHIGNLDAVTEWARGLTAAELREVAKITVEVQITKLRKVAGVLKGKTVAVYDKTGDVIPGTYVTPPETAASVSVNP